MNDLFGVNDKIKTEEMSFRYKQDMISYELYNLLYFIINDIFYTI